MYRREKRSKKKKMRWNKKLKKVKRISVKLFSMLNLNVIVESDKVKVKRR